MTESELRKFVRDVPDFPQEGILFRDVTPLLADAATFRAAVEAVAEPFRELGIERVIGIESRGFTLGAPVAMLLNVGMGLVRKAGKLPFRTLRATYDLEYGNDTLEMHTDAVERGQRILLVDDVIATGGTAGAAVELVRRAGADVVGASFLIELVGLEGRRRVDLPQIHSVLRY